MPTALEEVNAAKKAHALLVYNKLQELKILIDGQPEVWFGGLPPLFMQAHNNATFQAASLNELFELETV